MDEQTNSAPVAEAGAQDQKLPGGKLDAGQVNDTTQPPPLVKPSIATIPAALHGGRWCVWYAVWSPKRGKYDKIPYNGSRKISTARPSDWLTFNRAAEIYQQMPDTWAGVGKLVDPNEGLVYIDVDGNLNAEAYQNDFPTYCEVSPSGKGLRLIGHGKASRDLTKPLEIYSGHAPRYLTVTGMPTGGLFAVSDISTPVDTFIRAQPTQAATAAATDADMPEIIEEPEGEDWPMVTFEDGVDRSAAVLGEANKLYMQGYTDQQVLSILWASDEVQDMAMEHRRHNEGKAQVYLWENVCVPASESRKPQTLEEMFPNQTPMEPGQQAAADTERPIVRFVLPSDFHDYVKAGKQIFTALGKHHDMFARGNRVVETVDTGRGKQLDVVTPSAFQSRLDKYGGEVWQHKRDQRSGRPILKEKRCSESIAKALLSTTEAREYLPEISLVSKSPVLVDLGGGHAETYGPGYHPEGGGILVTGSTPVVVVELQRAVNYLLNLFVDFDFTTPADKSRAVAMMITPAMKMGGMFTEPTPMDVAEADKSQSGKTYRQKVVFDIYGEVAYPVGRRTGGVGSLDESLGAAYASGLPFIQVDNLRGKVDSQFLEMAMTSPEAVSARVPHKGEITVDARKTQLCLTSNGVESTRDLANRACIIRIRKHSRGYQWAQWPEGSLRQHVQKHQGFYLGCVHAVVRHWVQMGYPTTGDRRHDMHQWSGKLDWIVQNIFGLPPLMDGHEITQERVSNPSLVWLRDICLAVKDAGLLGKELSASDLVDLMGEMGLEFPRHGLVLDDRLAKQLIGQMFGLLYRKSEGEVLEMEGFQVTRRIASEFIESRKNWVDVKKYVFSTLGETTTV